MYNIYFFKNFLLVVTFVACHARLIPSNSFEKYETKAACPRYLQDDTAVPCWPLSGKCYCFSKTKRVPWADADKFCRGGGMTLLNLENKEEDQIINSQIKSTPELIDDYYWISGRFSNNRWEWATNEPLTYTHWYPGEPSHNQNGSFAYINYGFASGIWFDEIGPSYILFICESIGDAATTLATPTSQTTVLQSSSSTTTQETTTVTTIPDTTTTLSTLLGSSTTIPETTIEPETPEPTTPVDVTPTETNVVTEIAVPTEATTIKEVPTEATTKKEVPTEATTEKENPTEETTKTEVQTEATTEKENPTEETTKTEVQTEVTTKKEVPTEATTEKEIPTEETTISPTASTSTTQKLTTISEAITTKPTPQTTSTPMTCPNYLQGDANVPCWKLIDKCYCFSKIVRNWEGANRFCRVGGMTLLKIETAKENDLIYSHYTNTPGIRRDIYWTSGRYSQEGKARWEWANTQPYQPLVYKNWYPFNPVQPDFNQPGYCMDISFVANGYWYDVLCTANMKFICESN